MRCWVFCHLCDNFDRHNLLQDIAILGLHSMQAMKPLLSSKKRKSC